MSRKKSICALKNDPKAKQMGYLGRRGIQLQTRITFMVISIKFRWVAFFHLHFCQLFFLFSFFLHVKSSIFHQLLNAIKIISIRVQVKKFWAKLQNGSSILRQTLEEIRNRTIIVDWIIGFPTQNSLLMYWLSKVQIELS